ncbi:MAG: PKD domain-containing protein [Saprospiraceae bacterium]
MNLIRIFVVILIINFHANLGAQKFNANWVLGYSINNGPDSSFGRLNVDFSEGKFIASKTNRVRHTMDFTNASISDSLGNLLFYTNGLEVYNRLFKVMPNGDTLNPGFSADRNEDGGYTLVGGALILPWPDNTDKYMLLHTTIDVTVNIPPILWEWYSLNLLSTVIDINLQNGFGDVVFKNKSVFTDSIVSGTLNACKHANGRDWWINILRYDGTKMFTFLFDPSGISLYKSQYLNKELVKSNVGQCVYSKKGDKLAIFMTNDANIKEFLLFDFNRINGELKQLEYGIDSNYQNTGVAFSNSGEYLYATTGTKLYQLNMNESAPWATKFLIDTVDGAYYNRKYATHFAQMLLALDGKIYISAGRGSKQLSVIENPDQKGKLCNFKQFEIPLTMYNTCIPNFPNYNLGPIDGSICDTLGIDNIPWAWWRHEQDSTDYLNIQFTDLSNYEVVEWEWSFGDGMISTIQNPIHHYTKNGSYEVCLIAKNKNGSDTLSKILNIGTSSVENLKTPINIDLFPNPCDEYIIINVLDYIPEKMVIKLYDLFGNEILSRRLFEGSNVVNVESIHKGIYFANINEAGKKIISQKLIIYK